MKNFILAMTSFIATVLILSQVALAEDGWDPKHTQSAAGDEPAINTQAGRRGLVPEGSSPDSAEENPSNCKTCPAYKAQVNNLNDKHTVPSQMDQAPAASGGTQEGSQGAKGTK